mmetsp:Transcript_109858/g.251977  ORF Transcript_109858/g.251977 Transcript_109858/m.251977 type:complete len:330 (+) Transcript_109858:651-1640(+)
MSRRRPKRNSSSSHLIASSRCGLTRRCGLPRDRVARRGHLALGMGQSLSRRDLSRSPMQTRIFGCVLRQWILTFVTRNRWNLGLGGCSYRLGNRIGHLVEVQPSSPDKLLQIIDVPSQFFILLPQLRVFDLKLVVVLYQSVNLRSKVSPDRLHGDSVTSVPLRLVTCCSQIVSTRRNLLKISVEHFRGVGFYNLGRRRGTDLTGRSFGLAARRRIETCSTCWCNGSLCGLNWDSISIQRGGNHLLHAFLHVLQREVKQSLLSLKKTLQHVWHVHLLQSSMGRLVGSSRRGVHKFFLRLLRWSSIGIIHRLHSEATNPPFSASGKCGPSA